MTFDAPWAGLIAAALALPALLLLYFLKLRRERVTLGSTLLWQKSFEDLQVNAPFQRLRWTALLLVQFLLVLIIVLALAKPAILSADAPASRTILLIDRSASMNVQLDDGRTRLDVARERAADLIERIADADGDQQMMILAFASTPSVITGYESQPGMLRAAIGDIAATDEEADLEAALEAVSAFAQRGESDQDEPPDVVLITDGSVGEPSSGREYVLQGARLRIIPIDEPSTDNVGIVAVGVRRSYDDPGASRGFARLVSTSASAMEVVVRIEIDGAAVAVRRVEIPPATEDVPGEATLSVDFDDFAGGRVTMRAIVDDALPQDNVAHVIVPSSTGVTIGLVHPGDSEPDPFIEELLTALDPTSLRRLRARDDDLAALPLEEFELLVFDRVSAPLGSVPSISFGALPRGAAALPVTDSGGKRILSWERLHPVMRYVELDPVIFADFAGMQDRRGMTVLARGPDGVIISEVRGGGARHIVVGFALRSSNWPAFVSLAVFVQNAIEYLTFSGDRASGLVARPGDVVPIRAERGATEVSVMSADDSTGASIRINGIVVDSSGVAILPPLRRIGLYNIVGGEPPYDRLAVSMLSDQESETRVRTTIPIMESTSRAASAERRRPKPLWPTFVLSALVVAVLEWLLYCWRLLGSPSGR